MPIGVRPLRLQPAPISIFYPCNINRLDRWQPCGQARDARGVIVKARR